MISTAGAPPTVGVALPVYRWQRVIVAPRGHPLGLSGQRPSLGDLAALPLVSYDSSLRRAFEAIDLQPQIAITAVTPT